MDGEQRREQNGATTAAAMAAASHAGIQLSYGGFSSAACLPALLIVSLVYRGIPVA